VARSELLVVVRYVGMCKYVTGAQLAGSWRFSGAVRRALESFGAGIKRRVEFRQGGVRHLLSVNNVILLKQNNQFVDNLISHGSVVAVLQ
jgi:hypothetical protein